MAVRLRKMIPFLLFCFLTLSAEGSFLDHCKVASCGVDGPPIRFPFRLKGTQPQHCSYNSKFDLYCNRSNQTLLELPFSVEVFVNSIDYKSQQLRVSFPELCLHKQIANFNLTSSPFSFNHDFSFYKNSGLREYALFNCSGTFHRNSDDESYTRWGNISCLNEPGFEVIAVNSVGMIIDVPLLSCTRIHDYLVSLPDSVFRNADSVLSWSQPDMPLLSECRDCEEEGGQWKERENEGQFQWICISNGSEGSSKNKRKLLAGEILGPFLLIFVGVAAYCFYLAGIERQSYMKIKKFLEDYKALKPARYSYADIKRITNQFKEELGQGAFGTVFKGELSKEIEVAVKVLNNTLTGNGQEFINEMETMCQIHHVNVAHLVGFCADGLRRALVYEFLPNGSLQKFISSADTKEVFLGWEKLHDIALGIAKGIEYLHQGCDKRILHFDIKPQNVLLDHNFTPKISDFGLAKLCSKDQSIVSMTTARGTLGYIAPEVFSRNFGNVSYKSDVYSYGMVLLEMVGGRKITDVTTENNGSHVYYPQWIYNLLENEEDIKIHIEGEEDTKIAKKLSVVGLWCIQWHPANRPTMKAVIQMLEGNGEELDMPPNPFASTSTTKTNARIRSGHLNRELYVISETE